MRAKLLDAAASLLASGGLERVNSNQIAQAANVGVGSFYAHFKDKYELLDQLISSAVEDLSSAIEAALLAHARDRESQVRGALAAVFDWAESNPARFRVAFGREAAPAASTAPALATLPTRLARRLLGLQVQGRLLPELDAAVAAKAFTAMQNAVVIWWLESADRPPRARVIETLMRLHPAIAGATTGASPIKSER